eukprot:jgi/Mesvir1/22881/Mv25833-RA.1
MMCPIYGHPTCNSCCHPRLQAIRLRAIQGWMLVVHTQYSTPAHIFAAHIFAYGFVSCSHSHCCIRYATMYGASGATWHRHHGR